VDGHRHFNGRVDDYGDILFFGYPQAKSDIESLPLIDGYRTMKTEVDKSKEKSPAVSVKRPTKKKPKDKPKRPLSAYNFFFKEEREKILKVVQAKNPEKADNDPESEDYLDEEAVGKLRKEGGRVSFEEMGKLIGQRWKNIDPDRLAKYSELASVDTERYKKEMTSYNGRQEAKMRSEALKPQPTFPGRADMSKAGGMPDPSRGGYPDGMNSAFANPGMPGGYGYPGMDFTGYGMTMGGMYGPPYPGYPAMGGQGGPEGMGRMSGGGMDASSSQYGAGGGAGMYGAMGGPPAGYQGMIYGR